jgi:sugar lactone lactonase YvrE
MIRTVSFSSYLEVTQVVLSGVDALGNFFLSSTDSTDVSKYDQNGYLVQVTAWPSQSTCTGCPPPVYVNGLVSPIAMSSDPVTSDLYVTDNGVNGVGPAWISRYAGGQYVARLTPTNLGSGNDIAVATARKLYVADSQHNEIHVLDMNGKELTTLGVAQVGTPGSVAVDSSDNKYVLDFSNTTIHVLDSSDNSVTTLILSLPANYPQNSGSGVIRVGNDGNLVLYFGNNNTFVVKKLTTAGSELFSTIYSGSVFAPSGVVGDSKGNMFVAGYGLTKILDSKGNELGDFQVSNNGASDCGVTTQGDTAYVCYSNHIYVLSAQ